MTFDQITFLTETSNDGSPQHEDSIQSPITNQDKEMNDNLDKMQCSQLCSVRHCIRTRK